MSSRAVVWNVPWVEGRSLVQSVEARERKRGETEVNTCYL